MTPAVLATFGFLVWSALLTWYCFRAMMETLQRDRANNVGEKEDHESRMRKALITAASIFGGGILLMILSQVLF